ncbi:hypothetical protein GMORB2_6153 [Geosmithia morbida]|uniref:Uncharacterized protein n=1 Tax=Geosmithia morbida TaxID=1094350 RepID=A0A9P5D242_9HYPO|nr:uncharacterized protein GMORB2_6153 [Geosmithia morbida]KAF4123452.1 hypothetical protein GMORB2_6153 [Geosmithia morbida]
MTPPPWLILLRTLTLTLTLTLALTPSVKGTPTPSIFARDSDRTCSAGQDLKQCGASFPDNICCREDETCVSLAAATTILCCPESASCGSLKPITCNVQAQNATRDPDVQLKTTVFDVDLPGCGDGCCPFGFSCQDDDDGGKQCTMDQDQTVSPEEKERGDDSKSSSSPPPSSTSSSAPSTAGSATATATATDDTSSPSTGPTETQASSVTGTADPGQDSDSDSGSGSGSDPSGPDTTAIIGGVVGACAALLLVSVSVFVCLRRRAKRRAGREPDMVHGRNISEPITKPDTYRSEFMLRRPGSSADSAHHDRDQAQGPPIRGFFGRGSHTTITATAHNNHDNNNNNNNSNNRLSIPNRFASEVSPNPSVAESFASFGDGNVSYFNNNNSSSSSSSRNNNNSNDDDDTVTLRSVGARLPPIRSMKASGHKVRAKSSHLRPELAVPGRGLRDSAASQTQGQGYLNIFADPFTAHGEEDYAAAGGGGSGRDPSAAHAHAHSRSLSRETRFSILMRQADLGDVQNAFTWGV